MMTRGGASLMMSPWVGFASSPQSLSLRHTYAIPIVSSEVSALLITRGGASLSMSPWVGFASSPRSLSLRHTYAIAMVRSEVSAS